MTEKATDRTLDLIIESAEALGLLTEITGDKYVNLKPALGEDEQADLLYDEGGRFRRDR